MIPKQAIEKAIEGGWRPISGRNVSFSGCNPLWSVWNFEDGANRGSSISLGHEETVLDPAFWQALGKALGWKDEFMFTMEFDDMPERGADLFYEVRQPEWKYWYLRFLALSADGGDTGKYWNDLLA